MMIVLLFLLMTVLKDAILLKIPPKYKVKNIQDKNNILQSLSIQKPIKLPIPQHQICSADEHCQDDYICDLGSNSCVPGKA